MCSACNFLMNHDLHSEDALHQSRNDLAIPLIDYIQSAAENLNPPPTTPFHTFT